MEYAKSLIERKAADRTPTSGSEDIDDEVEEESWTFVGDGDDEDIDADAMLKRSSLFVATGDKALGTRVASNSSNSVLWTNAGTVVPLEHAASNSSGGASGKTARSRGDASPRHTQHSAEKRGR